MVSNRRHRPLSVRPVLLSSVVRPVVVVVVLCPSVPSVPSVRPSSSYVRPSRRRRPQSVRILRPSSSIEEI